MTTTYGPGGYDPDHPNGNVTEQTVDNRDGTATRTLYDQTGNVVSTEAVDVPPAPEPDPLELALAALTTLDPAILLKLGQVPSGELFGAIGMAAPIRANRDALVAAAASGTASARAALVANVLAAGATAGTTAATQGDTP